MPKINKNAPEKLRPYLFHGLSLDWQDSNHEAVGDCPWCGREGKFNVNVRNGMWRCFVCGEGTERGGGNIYVFIRRLWEMSDAATKDYAGLAANRRLLSPDTLGQWGVCRSIIDNEWLVPGYGVDGKLYQLYRYTHYKGGMKTLATPTLDHQLHGLYDQKKPLIYLCEGPWDAMAIWEVLGQCKLMGDKLVGTSSIERSLLSQISVLAAPGCTTFIESWTPLFADKEVVLLYDSDYPRVNPKTEKKSEPAGHAGMRRVSQILSGFSNGPKSIKYLKWGKDGYDPKLPNGTDLRDLLGGVAGPIPDLSARIVSLASLLSRVCEVPKDWFGSRSRKGGSGDVIGCLECRNYRTMISAWRKALKWTDGLDHALATMLASVASVKSVGDQLWVKIIGPASSGKSVLCEAISVNDKYILAKSTIRGFHSGFRTEGGEEDNSLVSLLYDKTLVTKDGDTLLQSPNLPQILSEARDLYDSTSRTHYRNAVSRDYQGVRMTWILCGTSSLRQIDSSELGERFLDCVIMEEIDDELEDEILWRVANRADRNLALESNGQAQTQYEPEMAEAMGLTGGYVSYLRETANEQLGLIDNPDWAKRRCTRLGKFVAHMRARPSLRQDETAEREFAARLVSQLIRLAKCLALVLNRKTVDEMVMQRVKQVALDTSRGQTMAIAGYLYDAPEGLEIRSLSLFTNRPEDKTRTMLRFLRQIGVVEPFTPISALGVKGRQRWRLTKKMHRLWRDVMEEPKQDA